MFENIVGARHVLTGAKTAKYVNGYRYGCGEAVAVLRPGSLIEMWRCLKACVDNNIAIILQAANTGLTGGSTPYGAYDRPVVLICTLRLKGIHALDGGKQVVCLPGTSLSELESFLAPLGREPHSVIGSSCIGASVVGGICNNSGGALVRRGPAYTELALYAAVNEDGRLVLKNHLGIELGEEPDEILSRLESGDFLREAAVSLEGRHASDADYAQHVRHIDAPTPARFNADPRRLYEASGSAGKIALFAARLDTFPQETGTVTFYIGTNNTQAFTSLRRDILRAFANLPISAEYIHREAFDIARVYGKDIFLAIERFGTHRIPAFFNLKAIAERFARRIPFVPQSAIDRITQTISDILPEHLPERMLSFRERFEHHLILKVSDADAQEARTCLARMKDVASLDYFECTAGEAKKAFLHRFAVAGAAVKYRTVRGDKIGDLISLDIALRRNDRDWFETLPPDIERHIDKRLYYGHFLCHVLHQDYVLRKGSSAKMVEAAMLDILTARGAEYPAEHNVGHAYLAKPTLAEHYRRLDPCNVFNPGIGQSSKYINWEERVCPQVSDIKTA